MVCGKDMIDTLEDCPYCQIEQLQAENDEYKTGCASLKESVREIRDERDKAEAENEKLKKIKERLKWLLDGDSYHCEKHNVYCAVVPFFLEQALNGNKTIQDDMTKKGSEA